MKCLAKLYCGSLAERGKPCSSEALYGSSWCWTHQRILDDGVATERELITGTRNAKPLYAYHSKAMGKRRAKVQDKGPSKIACGKKPRNASGS